MLEITIFSRQLYLDANPANHFPTYLRGTYWPAKILEAERQSERLEGFNARA